MMLAGMCGIPELQLDAAEAAKLAESIKNVAEHCELFVSPLHLAIGELFITASGIYGTRLFAYHLRKQAEERGKRVQLGPMAVPKPTAQAASVGA